MGDAGSPGVAGPVSERTRVRRGAPRARYERDEVLAILDAGLIAHVGVTTPDGPLVLPMAYGRDDDRLYLHGAAANHLLGTGRQPPHLGTRLPECDPLASRPQRAHRRSTTDQRGTPWPINPRPTNCSSRT